MGKKKRSAAESPKDRKAGYACGPCRLDVYLAVSHIHYLIGFHTELSHGLQQHIGGRFPAHIFTLAHRHIHPTLEQPMEDSIHARLQFVADNSRANAMGTQAVEHGSHTLIEPRMIPTVLHIVSPEIFQTTRFQGGIRTIRDSPVNKHPYPIAYKCAHLIACANG